VCSVEEVHHDLCEIIHIINFLNSEQLFSCCLSGDDLSPLSDMLDNEVAIMLVNMFRFAYNTTADIVLSFNNSVQSADHHLGLWRTGGVHAHYSIYMCFSFSAHWVYFITANVELDFV